MLRQAELLDPRRLVLSAQRIQVRAGLLDLLKSTVVIQEVSVKGLHAKASEGATGQLNLLEAIALNQPSTSDASSGGGLRIKLRLSSSSVGLDLQAMNLRIEDINLSGSLEASNSFKATYSFSTRARHQTTRARRRHGGSVLTGSAHQTTRRRHAHCG